MKKSSFLTKLKKEDALTLVEPSEEISKSYLIKSEKCIKVAELAYNAEIYENAVSEAYYAIYNSVLSLFFKCGIKCENHSGAVILIKLEISFLKFWIITERILKQGGKRNDLFCLMY